MIGMYYNDVNGFGEVLHVLRKDPTSAKSKKEKLYF